MHLPFLKNRFQLHRLLTIENPQKETIYGVIGRMEVLLDYFSKNDHQQNFYVFLKTYYLVTKKAADKYVLFKHYFHNVRQYELLDIYFATLYFEPMLAYLENGKMEKPWQGYFEYCKREDGIPLVQILLGINAHINGDLYKALVDLHYKNKEDFFLVNSVLNEIVPETILMLAEKHDLIGISGMAFRQFVHEEFRSVIVRWRKEMWEKAMSVEKNEQTKFYAKLKDNTELAAEKIIEYFTNIYHFHNLPDNIRKMNTLSVIGASL